MAPSYWSSGSLMCRKPTSIECCISMAMWPRSGGDCGCRKRPRDVADQFLGDGGAWLTCC